MTQKQKKSRARQIIESLRGMKEDSRPNLNAILAKIKAKFKVIEDNAGGLHLFVWNKGNLYYFSGYEYSKNPNSLVNDLIELSKSSDSVKSWDNSITGSEAKSSYEELSQSGEEIADNDGVNFDRLGSSGKTAFKNYK